MIAPSVSVIMAAYNGAAFIADTLASLTAQTLPDWEAIVVDDGSTDTTRAIVASFPDPRIRLIALPQNGGPVRARNHAVSHAAGRHIAALDQDDLCAPTRFATQVAWLDRHPDIALVGTAVEFLRAGRVGPSTYPPVTSPSLIDWLSWIENPLAWSSVMIRGEAARSLDPFTRHDLLYAEDFDLYHRIRPHGGIARLDEPLVRYRQHAASMSRRHAAAMEVNAARVLTERHAALLGTDAPTIARLLVVHNMAGRPVPDRASLRRLGEALALLQTHYLGHHATTATDVRLIRWETARRWARIRRASLRAGTLTLADLVAVRPDHLGMGYASPPDLVASRAVGAARRTRTRQTLAEKIIRPGPSSANT